MIATSDPSRREFVAAGAAALAWRSRPRPFRGSAYSAAELTAQQVVDRIRANVGVPWRDTTVDTFKAGDPQTIVTGIATTVMATLPVLRQAAAARPQPDRHLRADLLQRQRRARPARDRSGLSREEGVHRRAPSGRLALLDHWGARTPNEFADRAGRDARLDESPHRRDESADLRDSRDHAGRRWPPRLRARLGACRGGMRVIGNAGMRRPPRASSARGRPTCTTIDESAEGRPHPQRRAAGMGSGRIRVRHRRPPASRKA